MIRFTLRLSLLSLIASLIFSLIGLFWLITTPAGARFVAGFVSGLSPSLSLTVSQGNLISGVDLSFFSWQETGVPETEAVRIELYDVSLDWNWACFFRGEICVEHWVAQKLNIVVPDSPGTEDSGLSEVALPFLLHAPDIQIGAMRILSGNQLSQYADLKLSATWQQTEIRASKLSFTYEEAEFSGRGVFGMGKPWLMDIEGVAEHLSGFLDDPDLGRRIGLDKPIAFRLTGKDLDLEVRFGLEGEWPADVRFALDTQKDDLPFSVQLSSRASVPWQWQAVTSQLESWQVKVLGRLAGQTGTVEAAALDKTFGVVGLTARASWNDTGVELDESRLKFAEGVIAGRGGIHRDLAGLTRLQARLKATTVDLSGLLPDTPLHLSGRLGVSATLGPRESEVHLSPEKLEVQFLPGPTGAPFPWNQTLKTTLTGSVDLRKNSASERIQWRLAQQGDLPSDQLEGRWLRTTEQQSARLALAKGKARIGIEGSLSGGKWEAFVDLQKVSREVVQRWVALLGVLPSVGHWQHNDLVASVSSLTASGRLSGELAPEGGLKQLDARIESFAAAREEGVVGLNGTVAWRKQQGFDLDVRLTDGKQHLQATGRLQPESSALHIVASDLMLGAWQQVVTGQVNGDVWIKGRWEAPDITGTATLANVRYDNFSAAGLSLSLELLEAGKKNLGVEASWHGGDVSGRKSPEGKLVVSGPLARHRVSLEARVDEVRADLSCENVVVHTEGSYRLTGQCGASSADYRETHWALTGTPEFTVRWNRSRGNGVALDARDICYQVTPGGQKKDGNSAPGQACLQDYSWRPDRAEATFRFNHLSTGVLERLGIDQMPFEGQLSGEALLIDQEGEPLESSLVIEMPALTAKGRSEPLMSEVMVRLRTKNDDANLTLESKTQHQGRLRANLRIGALTGDKQLSGRVELDNLSLAHLGRLSQELVQAEGRLKVDVALSGTLDHPVVDGNWQLLDGVFGLAKPAVSLSGVHLRGHFDGRQMNATGKADVAGSPVEFSAHMDWRDTWRLDVRADARQVSLELQQGIRVTLSPSLALHMTPGSVELSGTVGIPEAQIVLRTLPADARDISQDVVYVDENKGSEAARSKWSFNMALDVVLGDKVYFKGLGVDTFLTGKLRLSQEAGGLLTAGGQLETHRGELRYWGQILSIEYGRLIFQGPLDDPQLDIKALRTIVADAVTVGIEVKGTAKSPEVDVFSEPRMDETDAAFYLVTGRKPEPGQSLGGEVVGNLLMSGGGVAGQWIAGRLMEKVGVSDFQISTQAESEGTTVQLSGYLTPNLQLRYGVKLFDEVNTLALRYRIGSNLFIEAMSGLNSSLDIIYSFEIR